MTGRVIGASIMAVAWLAQGGQQTPRFHSTVSGVLVNAFVTANGKPVTGLAAADFELRDRGVRQAVESIPASDVPLDLTLVVNVTYWAASFGSQVNDGLRRLSLTLGPADRVRLLACDRDVEEVRPMQSIQGGLSLGASTHYSGQRPIMDEALVEALVPVGPPHRRQVVVAIGPRVDGWLLGGDALLLQARVADAIVYFVALPDHSFYPEDFFRWNGQMAAATGGAFLLAPVSSAEERAAPFRVLYDKTPDFGGALVVAVNNLRDAFTFLIRDVRQGYVLTYTPAGVPSGGRHDLSLRVTRPGSDKFIVRTRQGYGVQ